MSYIKSNYHALLGLSSEMFKTKGGGTKYKFKVINIDGSGYCKNSKEIRDAITFDFTVVDKLPTKVFMLGGVKIDEDETTDIESALSAD